MVLITATALAIIGASTSIVLATTGSLYLCVSVSLPVLVVAALIETVYLVRRHRRLQPFKDQIRRWVDAQVDPSTREQVFNRIMRCYENGSTELDLSNCQLSAVPAEIRYLTRLKYLKLSYNPFDDFSSEVLSLHPNCVIDCTDNNFIEGVAQSLNDHIRTPGYSGLTTIYLCSTDRRLHKLYKIAGEKFFPLNMPLTMSEENTIETWLSRLHRIAGYTWGNSKRRVLAKLILQIVDKTRGDEEYRKVFFASIDEATSSCGDGMALSLLRIGIDFQISESLKTDDIGNIAYLLGHGSWVLNELEKRARIHDGDAAENYLGYPIKLRKRLKIPIVLRSMHYFFCSEISGTDLRDAEEKIKGQLSNFTSYARILCENQKWKDVLENHEETKDRYAGLVKARDAASEAATEVEGFAAQDVAYKRADSDFTQGLKDLTIEVLKECAPNLFLKDRHYPRKSK